MTLKEKFINYLNEMQQKQTRALHIKDIEEAFDIFQLEKAKNYLEITSELHTYVLNGIELNKITKEVNEKQLLLRQIENFLLSEEQVCNMVKINEIFNDLKVETFSYDESVINDDYLEFYEALYNSQNESNKIGIIPDKNYITKAFNVLKEELIEKEPKLKELENVVKRFCVIKNDPLETLRNEIVLYNEFLKNKYKNKNKKNNNVTDKELINQFINKKFKVTINKDLVVTFVQIALKEFQRNFKIENFEIITELQMFYKKYQYMLKENEISLLNEYITKKDPNIINKLLEIKNQFE